MQENVLQCGKTNEQTLRCALSDRSRVRSDASVIAMDALVAFVYGGAGTA